MLLLPDLRRFDRVAGIGGIGAKVPRVGAARAVTNPVAEKRSMKGWAMKLRARAVLHPLLCVATIASFLVGLSVAASAPPAAAVPPSPSPNADISVDKSVACSVASCPADTDVTYTITVSNGGP